MGQVKGVIFDMDGVVVDNHKYHFKAWMEFCEKYDYELNEQIYKDKFNGKTNADLFRMIFGDISEREVSKYAEEKESVYRKNYADHMETLKGLPEFLDHLQSKGIGIALGTSAPPENVSFILDNLDLHKYFNTIVDGSDVTKGKPDPQVYQMAASRLNLDPKTCIVFEDSLAGLESGMAAGCMVVGVATSHTASELKPKTDKIIHNFEEATQYLDLND